jgi:serine incorporator 1/3
MSACLGSLACCFGNAFCSLCCTACPACKGSTSTRIVYGLILLVSLILSVIMLIPGLETQLGKIPSLCKKSNSDSQFTLTTTCSNFVGSLAVYRVTLGVTVFFILMSFLVSWKDDKDEEDHCNSDDQSEILQ